jgi:uncharacterized protein YdhG (YjbR/CyaY superfamily)
MNIVDKYISEFPPETQKILQEIRNIIRSVAPESKETISYGIPTYKLGENLVHFAGFKNHIGFYPTPSGVLAFKKELSAYKNSKGSVQFPLNKPIPYDLIRNITEFRLKEVTRKV